MPAHVCTDDIQSKLPSGLVNAEIKSLTPAFKLSGKYVQGIVHHRYQLNRKGVPSLKFVISDSTGNTIDLLAIGQVAEDLDVCEKGDTLVCQTVEIEAYPKHYQKRCLLIADDTGPVTSLIWIFKEKVVRQSDSSSSCQPGPSGAQMKISGSTSKPRSYTYKPLSEVEVNTIVDVYGIVSAFKKPMKTKGSDYYCNVSLIDPSFSSPEEKLTCNFFNRDLNKLPNLTVGDIIRCHRLKIQNYQGKKQGYNGPGFQWLVFHGSVDNQAASSSSFTFDETDKDKVESLLNWWSTQGGGTGVSSTSSAVTLSQVQPKDYFDLVCQVVRACDLEPNICKVLRVWDGTKFKGQVKTLKEEEFNDTVREDETLMKASTDLTVDIFLFDNHAVSSNCINPGDYVQLTNLHAAVVSGQVEMTLHGGTWYKRGFEVLVTDSIQAKNLKSVLDPIIEKCKESVMTSGNLSAGNDQVQIQDNQTTTSRTRVLKKRRRDDSFSETQEKADVNKVNPGKTCTVESPVSKKNASSKVIGKKKTPNLNMERWQTGQNRILEIVNNSYSESSEHSKGVKVQDSTASVLSCEGCGAVDAGPAVSPANHCSAMPIASSSRQEEPNTSAATRNAESETASPYVISDDSSESVWVSAYDDSDFEHELLLTHNSSKKSLFPNPAQQDYLQDKSISSSRYHKNKPSHNEKADEAESDATRKMFLSLKSRKSEPDHADDNSEALAFTQEDFSSVTSGTLCFETAKFTESDDASQVLVLCDNTCTHIDETERNTAMESQPPKKKEKEISDSEAHVQNRHSVSQRGHENVGAGDSEVTSSSGSSVSQEERIPRCLLRTASVILGHWHVEETKLKDVLSHEVPHKFRILAHVQDYHPRPAVAENMVYFCCDQCHFFSAAREFQHSSSLSPGCPNCLTSSTSLRPTIAMTLLLSDGKDVLQAFLWDKNAIQFFSGIEPQELLFRDEAFLQVKHWLEDLCPAGSSLTDRPLLECCVFSYHVGSVVKYQIFDTALVK